MHACHASHRLSPCAQECAIAGSESRRSAGTMQTWHVCHPTLQARLPCSPVLTQLLRTGAAGKAHRLLNPNPEAKQCRPLYIHRNCLAVFATLRMGRTHAGRWAMRHRRQVWLHKPQGNITVHCWSRNMSNPCIVLLPRLPCPLKTGARAQMRRGGRRVCMHHAVQQRVTHAKFLKNRLLSAAYASTQGRVRGSLPSARSDWKNALPSRMFL